jgi:glutathione S-transferase
VLTEAAAILPFLADSFPDAGLGAGETPIARYALAQLLSYLTGEVHVAFKPYFTPQRFLDDAAQFPALKAHAFTVLAPMLQTLEARLGDADFILHGRRSVADAYLYVLLRWTQEAPQGLSPYPGLLRFRARLEADAGVAHALAAQHMSPLHA